MPRTYILEHVPAAAASVLQHYELWPTHFIDVTRSFPTAVAFAEGVGDQEHAYLDAFAMPDTNQRTTLGKCPMTFFPGNLLSAGINGHISGVGSVRFQSGNNGTLGHVNRQTAELFRQLQSVGNNIRKINSYVLAEDNFRHSQHAQANWPGPENEK